MGRKTGNLPQRAGQCGCRFLRIGVIATGCFAVVLAAAFLAASPGSGPQTDVATAMVVGDQNHTPAGRDNVGDRSILPEVSDSSEDSRFGLPHEESVATTEQMEVAAILAKDSAEESPEPSRRERLEAQLSVGEFGPAFDTAQSAPTIDERVALLRLVFQAQMKAGEFGGALASIGRMPVAEQRVRSRRERTSQQTLAGGGSGADFDSLIQLIQDETEGPWEEVDGMGGTMTEYETGVRVDPHGLLARLSQEEHSDRLRQLRVKARLADLNDDMACRTGMRLVSLTRLEKEVAKRIGEGRPVVETMRLLAGLTRIQYIFVYPEAGEIVLGGPAEGWRYDENGVPVGVESGWPTMQLDDLVTVLRTFSDGGDEIFGCSINPRQEGLKGVKAFVTASNARGPLRPGAQVRHWVDRLQSTLGVQDIELYGIPHESRVARVIVEADYRMKLIGIGKLDGGPHIPSYFDLLTVEEQKSSRLDALRWMLSVNCDAIPHSPDRDVFELRGSSVLCKPENQLVTDGGERIQTGTAEATNQRFADGFTAHYADLAQRDGVFADLQNIFDLALVAALIRNENALQRTAWNLGVFASDGTFRPAEFQPPKVVDTVANHRVYRGRDIVVQVAGGVRADLMAVVRNDVVLQLSDRLKSFAATGRVPQLPEGRWWWDVAK